jgi:hypothetical protein
VAARALPLPGGSAGVCPPLARASASPARWRRRPGPGRAVERRRPALTALAEPPPSPWRGPPRTPKVPAGQACHQPAGAAPPLGRREALWRAARAALAATGVAVLGPRGPRAVVLVPGCLARWPHLADGHGGG